MSTERALFVIPELPRPTVSVRGIAEGHEAVSGSLSSFLLVADGLARRGRNVAVLLRPGNRVEDTAVRSFADRREALEWAGESTVVWCSWGNERELAELNEAGARPWMWLQTDIDREYLRWLEERRIEGIVVVSDLTRLTSLHTRDHRRIGRVYNPLNPFFAREEAAPAERYATQRVVFTGYLGETKGAHRVLQVWAHVRERMPTARLTIVGSGRLYNEGREVGPFGVAAPEFEQRYLQPLADRFGSLEAAGVELAGLLSPEALREVYSRSALGMANLNWNGATETFCCTAVEMLATGLPVLSVARGGLPETIGSSGGAVLRADPAPLGTAEEIVRLLNGPERLRTMGAAGAAFARSRYDLERIVGDWERLLDTGPDRLDATSGKWGHARGFRYWTERVAGRFGWGRGLEWGTRVARQALRRGA